MVANANSFFMTWSSCTAHRIGAASVKETRIREELLRGEAEMRIEGDLSGDRASSGESASKPKWKPQILHCASLCRDDKVFHGKRAVALPQLCHLDPLSCLRQVKDGLTLRSDFIPSTATVS